MIIEKNVNVFESIGKLKNLSYIFKLHDIFPIKVFNYQHDMNSTVKSAKKQVIDELYFLKANE